MSFTDEINDELKKRGLPAEDLLTPKDGIAHGELVKDDLVNSHELLGKGNKEDESNTNSKFTTESNKFFKIEKISNEIDTILSDFDNTENNFVEESIANILLFIQNGTRINEKIKSLDKQVLKMKQDEETILKADALKKEEIRKLGTGNERELAAKEIANNNLNPIYAEFSTKLEEIKNFYSTEISLAKEIIRLKSLNNGA